MSPSINHHDLRGVSGVPTGEPVNRLHLVGKAPATGAQLRECSREFRMAAGTSIAELREHLRRDGLPAVTIATVPTPTGRECRRIVRHLGGWSL